MHDTWKRNFIPKSETKTQYNMKSTTYTIKIPYDLVEEIVQVKTIWTLKLDLNKKNIKDCEEIYFFVFNRVYCCSYVYNFFFH